MLKVAMLALGASLTVGAIAPHDAAAQSGRQRSQGRGDVRVERRDDRRDDRVIRDGRCYDDRYDDRYDDDSDRYERRDRRDRDGRAYNCDDDGYRTAKTKKGNGPPFCRNGQGHPVHGMAWCRDKGWGYGSSMRNVRWEDVILRRPRADVRRDLGRSVLEQILGRRVYDRFDDQRERLGLGSSMYGRWQDSQSGARLNLFSGGVQVAQILDRNRDGRADVVLLNYGR